jgi:hypothetical protein
MDASRQKVKITVLIVAIFVSNRNVHGCLLTC